MATVELQVCGRLTCLTETQFKNDDGTQTKKRIATLVFDKDEFEAEVNKIQAGIKQAMTEEFGKTVTPKYRCIKDGDVEAREDDDLKSPTFGERVLISDTCPHLKNAYYISKMNADHVVMYNTNKRIISWEEFVNGNSDMYVGAYVQAKVSFSVYTNQYGIMISKYLNALALLRDGEPIVGNARGDYSPNGFVFKPATTDSKSLLDYV